MGRSFVVVGCGLCVALAFGCSGAKNGGSSPSGVAPDGGAPGASSVSGDGGPPAQGGPGVGSGLPGLGGDLPGGGGSLPGLGDGGVTSGPSDTHCTSASCFSGTVVAPAGSDLSGVVLAACPIVNGAVACDDPGAVLVALPGSAASASFGLDVPAGTYGVIAFKDVNGSGTLDAGDLEAIAGDASGKATPLMPPFSGIVLNLEPVAGSSSGGSVLADVVGTWTSAGSAYTRYTIASDGTYTEGAALGGAGVICSYSIDANGQVAVSGDQLTFTPAHSVVNELDCSNNVTGMTQGSLDPVTYTWSIATDPGTGATTLTLTPSSGGSIVFTKS